MTVPCIQAARRGAVATLLSSVLFLFAAIPARVGTVLESRGTVGERLLRVVGGVLLDIGAVAWLLIPLSALLALAVAWLFRRRAAWQFWGPLVCAAPVAFACCVLSVVAQEVKNERGAFPTVFDLAEGGSNLSFLEGTLGYLRYFRIWAPVLATSLLVLGLLIAAWRWHQRGDGLRRWQGWAAGVGVTAVVLACGVTLVARGAAQSHNRLSPAFLGDPLTGIVESGLDMVTAHGASTPRRLVFDIELPIGSDVLGAQRIGWPTPPRDCAKHPFARPLDRAAETPAPANGLIEALERSSEQLFADGVGDDVHVFLVLLESFRADDLNALNPLAPAALHPMTNGLYAAAGQADGGVVASRKTYQAGVRSAQGMGALLCGVGTLPYNLSVVRDLQPIALRCATDVLASAGFGGHFFFGSDPNFDEMSTFLGQHGFGEVVSQKQLPANVPQGAWGGATDLVVVDEAIRRITGADAGTPGFSLVMSLSNHSPYTRPEDVPAEVQRRVDEALATQVHHAEADDAKRLLTHTYTDYALQRFFERLDASGLSSRSIVLVAADHSTGENYIWGPETGLPETDDAKSRIPFLMVVPSAFRHRLTDARAFEKAWAGVQRELDAQPLSQNDWPALVLALLSRHPALKSLPEGQRWHTLGGQRTSPHFNAGGVAAEVVVGINGISEFFSLDANALRVGDYEDSVFLKTRADRYRVTPRLIPAAATLQTVLRCSP